MLLRKSWLLLLESIKTQYLAICKESVEFMSIVSSQPANIGPQDVPRTSPKDPI